MSLNGRKEFLWSKWPFLMSFWKKNCLSVCCLTFFFLYSWIFCYYWIWSQRHPELSAYYNRLRLEAEFAARKKLILQFLHIKMKGQKQRIFFPFDSFFVLYFTSSFMNAVDRVSLISKCLQCVLCITIVIAKPIQNGKNR